MVAAKNAASFARSRGESAESKSIDGCCQERRPRTYNVKHCQLSMPHGFKHGLTQEVAYNSLLIERRKKLHEQIGAAIEALYSSQLSDHLSELAHHYQRSGNIGKAL